MPKVIGQNGDLLWRKPIYFAEDRGVTWSVVEQDAQHDHKVSILHNLTEWQARSIAAILRANI